MLDCTGCNHRPKPAEAKAEGGEGLYCAQFSQMPQVGQAGCTQHTKYDAAKKEGDARLKAGIGKQLNGPSGSYIHLPIPVKTETATPAQAPSLYS